MRKLANKIKDVEKRFAGARFWRHYKGDVYEFLGLVILTDNGEVGVRYKSTKGQDFFEYGVNIEFVRPFHEWFDDVEEAPKKFVPRFKKVRKVDAWADTETKELYQPS